ncbi:MAG: efflux RND transporter periplasmic adaptor subunit [Oceanospirillales bacterium]|nr:efflux RND transporter periplasmic adaptor subunit [Oceanospirillales bacterium]MBR9887135.1 efflux RND transporter periplasmic adaptor subunit [Oceanospirillales bacterium]
MYRFIGLVLILVSALSASPTLMADTSLTARAVITALDRATLSGELVSNVVALPVRMGDAFKKGEALVELDCGFYKAQLKKSKAELSLAETKVDNAKKLNALQSIGEFDLAVARAELGRVRADYELAQLNIRRCTITAPFDGRVVDLLINEFEMADQQPLIEIVGTERYQADIVVPASWISWITEGTELLLHLDETGVQLPAVVTRLSPAVDTVSQTLKLVAKFSSVDGVVAGMSATALFDSTALEPVSVPE